MNSLRSAIADIGLEELMNCILVQHDVRPGVLIQPADYNERDRSGPHTAHILVGIAKRFPELKQSVSKEGVLISKRAYTYEELNDATVMGKALGYPCASDFEYVDMHRDEPSVGIQITVHLKPGGESKSLQLLANLCRNESTFPQSVAFAKAAEFVLKADPLVGSIINSVIATKRVIIPTKALIRKLVHNEPLTQQEDQAIRNSIWNLDFPPIAGKSVSDYIYDYTNPVHRGILLGLLTYYDNTPLSAFYPLQNHPESHAVNTIMGNWGNELIHVLDETRTHTDNAQRNKHIRQKMRKTRKGKK